MRPKIKCEYRQLERILATEPWWYATRSLGHLRRELEKRAMGEQTKLNGYNNNNRAYFPRHVVIVFTLLLIFEMVNWS